MNFLRNLIKELDDDNTSIMDDGLGSAEFTGFIDTGSYVLNGLLSGTIFGGLPNNKVLGLAGDEATGKSFFTLGMMKYFLDSDPDASIVYYETESSNSKKTLLSKGIDTKRVLLSEPETVEQFKHHALKVLDFYRDIPKKDRKPMMFVLDSLGQLSTNKEMNDSVEGKDVRDMTRAPVIKSAFRTLRLKLAKLGVPLVVVNHTYQVVGAYVPTKDMGGGSGLKYAADFISFLSKSKHKDATTKEVTGSIITVRMKKSRLSKENIEGDVLIDYSKGLDRYYGLINIAITCGIFKKGAKTIEYADGKSTYEKNIVANPEKYFTQEILEQIDVWVKNNWNYGVANEEIEEDSDTEE